MSEPPRPGRSSGRAPQSASAALGLGPARSRSLWYRTCRPAPARPAAAWAAPEPLRSVSVSRRPLCKLFGGLANCSGSPECGDLCCGDEFYGTFGGFCRVRRLADPGTALLRHGVGGAGDGLPDEAVRCEPQPHGGWDGHDGAAPTHAAVPLPVREPCVRVPGRRPADGPLRT